MNLKALIEKRNAQAVELKKLLDTAVNETRALTEDENKKFNELEAEIKGLDDLIEKAQRDLSEKEYKDQKTETLEEKEVREFAQMIREYRAGEKNFSQTDNGVLVPLTIAKRIIKAVEDKAPIYARATKYYVKGKLAIPVYGKSDGHDITVAYQGAEFTALTADAGKFTSVDLSGYAAGALSLISQQLITNADIDIVNFVVNEMSDKIATWLEGELIKGTGTSACQGITVGCTNTVTTAAATAITADELIELQAAVKQAYQDGACFIMHPDTFTKVKQLKDGNNRYLLQDDATNEFPYRLLGKPVFLSDNMAKIAGSAKTVIYGDLSGLAVKMARNINVNVLREKYIDQNAIGVIAWLEVDSKVANNQKLAVLVQKNA